MHNLKYLTLALLLASLIVTPAFAKPGHYEKASEKGEQKASRLEHLKEELDLTVQQEAEIREILASTTAKNKERHNEKRKTRKELREISTADTLDEARLRELVRKQSDQRADMMVAKHATRARINEILTPEQQKKHEAFRQQRQEQSESGRHRKYR